MVEIEKHCRNCANMIDDWCIQQICTGFDHWEQAEVTLGTIADSKIEAEERLTLDDKGEKDGIK